MDQLEDRHQEPMARAVALGDAARRRTAPNPWVGCVLVRDGVVVGEGASEPAGGRHAEVLALAEAGSRACGATAFVTLEPCSHHGRTPPCADALLDAGVARVQVALADPDPRVQGEGIARLRAGGVDVAVHDDAAAARSLAPYLHHRRTGRAWCVAKTASSLDGRVTAADGTSRWITGPAARADAHELRADSQAVVIGSATALADRPTLDVRDVTVTPRVPPLRVVLDGRGRVPAGGDLFDTSIAPTMVLTTDAAPIETVDQWRCAGAEVETIGAGPRGVGVDLEAALALLGREGVLQAMFEGGPTVHGGLLAAGLVDRIVAYVAGVALGPRGRPSLEWDGPPTLAAAPRFGLRSATALGDDVRLDLVPVAGGEG
ncbi:MAG TPA: bifunctional diaminohydroxyphosphoribosylaminopyrimidine deaminase/5-amino-6-(5-phosphoribosylamino)uracil reductase RibD [Acidimicrobiia bacterium]|nr:bifunctional diaminohydroxyphosphoribosylaminopyrimidine deaminase/5-amino-6-(5-phosphoribosylamino)uracil reductase RibD [Acidimicrobiia bacterium]